MVVYSILSSIAIVCIDTAMMSPLVPPLPSLETIYRSPNIPLLGLLFEIDSVVHSDVVLVGWLLPFPPILTYIYQSFI